MAKAFKPLPPGTLKSPLLAVPPAPAVPDWVSAATVMPAPPPTPPPPVSVVIAATARRHITSKRAGEVVDHRRQLRLHQRNRRGRGSSVVADDAVGRQVRHLGERDNAVGDRGCEAIR